MTLASTLHSSEIRHLAELLDQAMFAATERERLTVQHPTLTLDDAYLIQDEGIKLRLARGERLRGLKMGLTSKAKMEQMGLTSPVYGVLTREMEIEDGGAFQLSGKIHPKIEPEIAFLMKRGLRGPQTMESALEAVGGVCAAMEILDSRYVGFKYFSLPDVVADNSSSAYFVLGREVFDPRGVDLSDLSMKMRINGELTQAASSSEIFGHPVLSLMKLCEILDSRGLELPAGSVVLAGAATQAVQLASGMRVELEVETLGKVGITVTE